MTIVRPTSKQVKKEEIEIELNSGNESGMDEENQESVGGKNIEIRKPNYPTREKGLPNWSPEILPKHFAMGVVGRPNAGKSHLIYEFLTNPKLYY